MKTLKIKRNLKAFQDEGKTQKYFPQNERSELHTWPYPRGTVYIIRLQYPHHAMESEKSKSTKYYREQ